MLQWSRFTAQPAEKGALQERAVEPVGFGAAVFTRHRDAGRVDDIGFDVARPQPAGQPEAVTTRLKSLPRRRPGATAIRVIMRPALPASSRQRCSSPSSAPSSGSSFFAGWRSTPGTIPVTSQFDWLISMTAINVLS